MTSDHGVAGSSPAGSGFPVLLTSMTAHVRIMPGILVQQLIRFWSSPRSKSGRFGQFAGIKRRTVDLKEEVSDVARGQIPRRV